MKRFAIGFGLVLALLLVLSIAIVLGAHQPRPEGRPGAKAEALAERMKASVDLEAWARTGYVRWTFGDRQRHQWDRERALVRVRWRSYDVRFALATGDGIARRDGALLQGEEAAEAIESARRHWNNDSYWLNPIAKIDDPGTERSFVEWKGEPGLLVEHTRGGTTPGDAYLWLLAENGRPKRWLMWVQIIPIGGLSASWEGWRELSTGAWVSTAHDLGPLELRLSDVEAAHHWSDLEPEDPFAEWARP